MDPEVHARPRGAFDMGLGKVSERRELVPWRTKGLRGARRVRVG